MKETAERVNPGFSVADAEDVSLETVDEDLKVTFTDWREEPVTVLFIGAVSHRWEAIEPHFLEGERFDCVHVIHGSEWLKRHLEQGAIYPDRGHQHYRLNFNACGTLEVLACGFEVKPAAGPDADGNRTDSLSGSGPC